MEILAEAFVALLEVIGEILLQLLVEVGLRASAMPFRDRKPLHPVLSAIGYTLLGGALGAISVHFWPTSVAQAPWARLTMLLLVPLLAASAMSALGAWRRRHDQPLIRLDRFGYAFLFAFALSLARFVWAR